MNVNEQLSQRGIEVTRREYDDRTEFAADFGPAASVSVDVVDQTVIVVAGEETYDLEVDGDAQAFIKNGVLTIEMKEEGQ